MLQRYKLRLGDGTVLGVDHEGLRTWAVDSKAMVQAADSHEWYPLKEFLAAEYVAARRAARQRASALPAGTPRPLPLVYPKPREDKAAPPPDPAPSELPPFIAEPSEVQASTELPPGTGDSRTDQVGVPEIAIPGVPIPEPLFEPVQAEDPVDVQPPAEDPIEAPVWTAEPILAEETTAAGADLEQDWIPDDGVPALTPPFAGREDVPVVPVIAQGPLPGEAPQHPATPAAPPPLESPLAGPRPSLQTLADDLAPGRPGTAAEARKPDDELPIIPLKPLDDEAPVAAGPPTDDESPDRGEEASPRSAFQETLLRWFGRGTSAYDALLTGWINRLARRPRSMPPPIHELPLLRLADTSQPVKGGDVYQPESRLHGARRPTVRIVVTSGLLMAGLIAVLGWEIWVPRAERFGHAVFMAIDRVKESREHRERRRQALDEAMERLPHLAPQTIELLMDSSPTGILDPPDLFRVASDATDSGVKALTSEELVELKQLLRDLLKSLRPSERERVREYDAARVRRLVFPFEGRDVLELFGRGAYALPQERRERLQELLGKAIAAGLPPSSEAAPRPPAEP